MDGKTENKKYYLMSAKIYAQRFSTDCFSDYFNDMARRSYVKYTFGSAGGDVSGYSVKIVPHVVEGKDFDFTLDDQVYSFQAETDLTAGFNIAREETSFTITPKSENGNVANVLQAVYPNNTIGGCEDKGYEDMYSLIVTSYNGEASVTLHFSILQDAAGVTLDKEVIVF